MHRMASTTPKTGDTLVQGKSGLPIFVGVMAFGVKMVIDKAAGHVSDGDVWIFNDPYEGGTHLSDLRLVRPVFREGQVFCWLASVGHWHDVGGNVPGNYNPAATESFQEGFLLPPVKLFDRGDLRQDVIDILLANSRLPNSAYGDLMGQINALDLGVKRLEALLDDFGDVVVSDGLGQLKARAAALMRAEIAALPDGTISVEDWLDNDGIVDQPLKVALDLTIDGERMVMDFSRSAPACAGPVNISRSTTIAACYVALKHVFGEVPANAGVLEPIAFDIPNGSLLSAVAPKPVGGYTETILRLIDLVFQAVAQIAPERANGCAYGTINALSLAGHRADGRRWVMFSFFWWRSWWSSRGGWSEPWQCADLHRHDPASGNSGSGLSRQVHAMGVTPKQRRRWCLAWRIGRGLRDLNCWNRTPRFSSSGTVAGMLRAASSVAAMLR